MTPREVIAAALTDFASYDIEPYSLRCLRGADAVLAALTDAGIVLCREIRWAGWYVPVGDTP